MLATLSGDVCLLFGLALLLLPLLAVELSRPRDGVWGAVVLLLGLVLVTSSDRLRGAPMLAVLCGSMLVSRLSAEVGQARWRTLDDDERQRLGSSEYWLTGLKQLGAAASSLTRGLSGAAKQLKPAAKSGVSGKKWVRPDTTSHDDQPSADAEETISTAMETQMLNSEEDNPPGPETVDEAVNVAEPETVAEPEAAEEPKTAAESNANADPTAVTEAKAVAEPED